MKCNDVVVDTSVYLSVFGAPVLFFVAVVFISLTTKLRWDDKDLFIYI